MRILFTTWAWSSHLLPLVPFAWACRAAGHEVCVASQPSLVDAIARSGLPAVSVGRDVDDGIFVRHENPEITLLDPRSSEPGYVFDETEQFRWKIMKAIFAMVSECMVDDLVAFTGSWHPDLIVSDQTTFAASVAAKVSGVPHARLLYGPDITGPRGRDVEPMLRPDEFTRLFTRFGVEPDYDLARWTIDPCPPSLRTPTDVERIPMRYVPYNGGGAVPGWLLDPPARPRVCITWGTSQLQLANDKTIKVPEILAALAGQDLDVLVLGGDTYRHLLADVPANVHVFGYLPLTAVLPGCSAVIHQGGAGNALTSAYWGVPQLMFPQVADQGVHSERVAATGAGHVMNGTEDILESILALLGEPRYRKAAASLRQEILDQPAPTDVVRAMEERVAAAT